MDDVGSARNAVAVTPHDTTALVARALYVGGAGNVAVRLRGMSAGSVTFASVPAGTILPIETSLVLATGTTATSILALS